MADFTFLGSEGLISSTSLYHGVVLSVELGPTNSALIAPSSFFQIFHLPITSTITGFDGNLASGTITSSTFTFTVFFGSRSTPFCRFP